jgi:plastocyanin domain-containing protein
VSPDELAVAAAGSAGIVWVYWYFFVVPSRATAVAATAATASGPQTVRIEVHGGYAPAVVRVRAGRPVRLEFHRDETNPCTEEVVLPDFGIRRRLPAHRTTAVEFTPDAEGTHEFACGMGMVRGRVVVET